MTTATERAGVTTGESSQPAIARELAAVAVAFFASRLLIFGTIYLSRLEIIRGPFWQAGTWRDALTHGDAAAYLDLARNVGSIASSTQDPTISFFPVYPLVVSFLALVLQNVATAGVLVSNLCLAGAGWLMYRLVQFELGDEQLSRASVMFLMFGPGALFFSTATADSMFLLLSIASLLAARTARWPLATAFGVLAAATMNLGLLLVVPLCIELAVQMRGGVNLRWKHALPLALIPAQLGAALLIGHFRFNDSFALLRLSADTQATFANLVSISTTFANYGVFWQWVFSGTSLVAFILCIAAVRMKLRASNVAFAAVLLVACVMSQDPESPRTLAVAFPLYAAQGVIARRFEWTYEALLLAAAGLLALFTVLFANGHWMT